MVQPRILAACGLLAASAVFAAKPVLRVNGADISDSEIDRAKAMMGAQARGAAANDPRLLRAAIEEVISRTLLLQAARAAGVTVDLNKVAAQVEAQRDMAGGADAFAKALAAHGLTEQEFAKITEDSALLDAYINAQIYDKIAVGDAEVKAYYDQHPDEFKHPEQVKLRMIAVRRLPGADDAAKGATKAKAEAIRQKLLAGADFAATAAASSDHPNKSKGGEVGWVRLGMLPQMEQYFWDLKPGAISDVEEATFGFVIFKVDERRPAGTMTFEEVKGNLARMLRMREGATPAQKLIADLRAKAKIEPLDPAIKAALETPLGPAAPLGAATPAPAVQPAAQPPAAKPASDAPKSP